MARPAPRLRPLLLAAALLPLAGCAGIDGDAGDDGHGGDQRPGYNVATGVDCGEAPYSAEGSQGPTSQQGVTNYCNGFSYSGQTTAKAATEEYVWRNTHSKAYVNWGAQSATGTVSVSVKDAAGEVVFNRAMDQSQSNMAAYSGEGRAGDWTITIQFLAYTGQFGLTITAA